MSMKDSDTTSVSTGVSYEPKTLVLSSTHGSESSKRYIQRTQTNGSLYKVISGIQDDRELDRKDSYLPTGQEVADVIEEISRPQSRSAQAGSMLENSDERSNDHSDITPDEVDAPKPDTGYAWFMAVCGLLAVFSTWGSNASFGVFLNFYTSHDTFPEAGKYDYALIGGIVMFCAQFLAPFSILIYQVVGHRPLMILGVCLQTAGYILASFATRLWQLYLTQGLLVGLSFVMVFLPATMIVPTWFDKYIATCMGIMVSGAGVGGLVFSLSLNKVMEQTGDQRWALRMVGFICLFTAIIPAVFLKNRTKSAAQLTPLRQRLTRKYISQHARVIFDFSVFNNYALICVAFWFAICLLGYTLMLYSTSSYAKSVGLSDQQGSSLTSIMNAAQIVGRPLMGLTSDAFTGRSTFASGISFLIGILLLAWWINADSYGSLIAFVVVIGLVIGVGSTMAQSLASDILKGQRVASAWCGMNMLVGMTTLVAEVIALALVRPDSSNPYLHTQIFSGCCFLFCGILALIAREYLVRRKLHERQENALNHCEEVAPSKDGDDEKEIIQSRISRYQILLKRSLFAFFIRCFYPIKA
ncbi:hypothetical protein DIURU_003393 [Diutina rugosa]|uniref:Major facilitator superfamily (MFS) profile domain-containing protein n=1 Tax=Diutina rugosa TaxID=5481 RepID=A0A642UL35_DIURU|nr:uncharacterized protein DIURU_003393 [Diutina rugosa]KAA8901023.1 hypothetical protein DIURU_003393 [Diutina rugosa]